MANLYHFAQRHPIMLFLSIIALSLSIFLGSRHGSLSLGGPSPAPSAKPNFILIMTDDQDLLLDSLDYQPAVNKHFTKEGTFFKRHFCTIAVCCPSRVSLLTGKAAHNTNVTDVSPPYGKLHLSSPC
jgi:N-acetylglucosamine-6-sulfatase